MNIECTKDIFVDTKDNDPETFVNGIREACGRYYGTAGIAFLEYLFGVNGDAVDCTQLIQQWEAITEELQVPQKTDQQKRVIRRLGIIALAGQIAVECGILPYSREEVIEAVIQVRDLWFDSCTVLSDAQRAVQNIKEAIENNLDCRIQNYSNDAVTIKDRIAFKLIIEGQELFLFTMKDFKRICDSVNTYEVCRYLDQHGLLHMNNKPRYQSRFVPIGSLNTHFNSGAQNKRRVSLYAVKASILDQEF